MIPVHLVGMEYWVIIPNDGYLSITAGKILGCSNSLETESILLTNGANTVVVYDSNLMVVKNELRVQWAGHQRI